MISIQKWRKHRVSATFTILYRRILQIGHYKNGLNYRRVPIIAAVRRVLSHFSFKSTLPYLVRLRIDLKKTYFPFSKSGIFLTLIGSSFESFYGIGKAHTLFYCFLTHTVYSLYLLHFFSRKGVFFH